MKRPASAAVLVLLVALLPGPPSAAAATTARSFDFDGNGRPDLVVGSPTMDVRTARSSGGVVVLPASSRGLSSVEKVVTQSSRGVPGASETGDKFGTSVASADFDRDGYADLAVGQPGEQVDDLERAGAVTVIHGSHRGLDTARSTGFAAPSGAVRDEHFGEALVAGDFNADGYPDLAVGAPWVSQDSSDYWGSVTLVPGGPTGLTTEGARELRQQEIRSDDWQASYRFGSVLAAGDLDGDGTTDLVVGSGPDSVGSVSYCLGRRGGPAPECTRLALGGDFREMTSLAVAHLRGTARPQIIAGSPRGVGTGGGLLLLDLTTGAPLGLQELSQLTQASPGVPGSDEPSDGFGQSLATGDTDRDGYDDLVVGVHREDSGEGRVTVLHGGPDGVRASGGTLYDQDTPGIPGGTELEDRFGSAVTLLDHDGDGRLDLTVGAPGENGGSGAITTLRGSGSGFTTTGSRTFGLATLDHPYPARASFGATLGR